jgi:hypothetical protein
VVRIANRVKGYNRFWNFAWRIDLFAFQRFRPLVADDGKSEQAVKGSQSLRSICRR